MAAQPVFGWGQRTGPGQNFNQNAPNQRAKVQPAQQRPAAGQKGSEHHPRNEKEVQCQYECCKEYINRHL